MPNLIAVVDQTWINEDAKNVLGVQVPTADVATLQAITDAIALAWDTEISSRLDNNWSLDRVTFYDADAAPGTPGLIFAPTLGPVVGQSLDTPVPKQACLYLSHTCEAGPPWRGRSYLAGCVTGDMTSSGRWDTPLITAANNLFAGLRTAIPSASAGALLGVIRRPDANSPVSLFAPITASVARSNPGTQQRRRIGRGA